MSETESKHYLANGDETLPDAREALEWAAETRVSMVDLKFCDLLGTWQHMTLPLRALDAGAFEDGLGFDGSSIRGWQGISESDMLLMPDPTSAILDPGTEAPTLSHDLRDRRPDHARGLLARPTPGRQARRGVPALHRDRRHVLRRPRVRVLRLRRGQLRPRPERRALLGRLLRGLLELRQAGPRLHVSPEGGLLPDGAARLAARSAHGDGADARAARDRVRVPPPRGRLRRPVRDRSPLRLADEDGRPGHDLQVRGQERRPRARQVRHLHAEADLRRQRLGDALPPVPVEGRDAADGGQVGLRGSLAARPRATSAACSSTRPRCSRSARRRRTRTAGSCPATRRR